MTAQGPLLVRPLPPLLVVLLTVAASVAPGCATRRSVQTLQTEIEQLQQENFQLKKDLAEARVRLEMQASQQARARKPDGPSDASGEARHVEPSAPGRTEVAPRQPAAPKVIFSDPITDPSPFLSAAPQAGRAGGYHGRGLRPVSPARQQPFPDEPARMMQEARHELEEGRPSEALAVFRRVIARFPDEAVADDAQLGAGECFFQMGRYQEAIIEYRRVAEGFPFGDQVPYALLKIGFAHLALEQRDLAMDSFRTVSEAYPGTEAATVARQQIAHLRASGR